MNRIPRRLYGILLAAGMLTFSLASSPQAEAAGYRQSYSSWNYYPSRSYYYSRYSYRPSPTITTYSYHYCVYIPSQPRYVYYYNPVRRVYWGRYDLKESGYSLLAEKDRKEDLASIPETAFPKPGKMPLIPESDDGQRMDPPNPADLPELESPKDAP